MGSNKFTGDISPIFCPLENDQIVEADCFNEVQCSCCTSCCDSPENECVAKTSSPTEAPVTPTIRPSPEPSKSRTYAPSLASPVVLDPAAAPVTLSPSEILSQRFTETREVLLQISSEETLDDIWSPQYKTMEWLVVEDEAQLSPTEETALIQRYTIALVYFAMNGPNWWNNYGFLGADSVCEWNDRSTMGCFCSDNTTSSRVQELSLCKSEAASPRRALFIMHAIRHLTPSCSSLHNAIIYS